MLRAARYYDPQETLRLAMEGNQTRLWTALPCVVTSVDKLYGLNGQSAQMTIDLQPTVNGIFTDALGVEHPMQMPVLLDCPVIFPSGGGVTITLPVAVGNECLVLIASRCIDAWWQLGWQPGQTWPGAGNPAMNPPDLRMHNLSDGFALPGVKSLPNIFTPDQNNLSIQSNDGTAYFKLNPTTHAVSIVAPGGINLNGATVSPSGIITDSAGVVSNTHTHSGVQTGGGDTGAPVT